VPPKLLALPRTLACVARRDSGLTESKTRMTNPTDLHHLAVSLSFRPYFPSHRRPHSSWLCVTESLSVVLTPTKQILGLGVSRAWVAYWRCAEAGSPVQSSTAAGFHAACRHAVQVPILLVDVRFDLLQAAQGSVSWLRRLCYGSSFRCYQCRF
jgi:hypothetical protein